MAWLFMGLLQLYFIVSGIRQEEKTGQWSWSKFFFALAFAGLECGILIIPLNLLDQHGRNFGPVMAGAGVIAALNFIWFIIACRRWRLPDGRTSLQAYYDEHPKK